MTYPQPPYQPPGGYGAYGPYAMPNLAAYGRPGNSAAKFAAILMWVLGGMYLLCGGCFAGLGYVNLDTLPPEMRDQMAKEWAKQNITFDQAKALQKEMIVPAVVALVSSLALIVVAFFVIGGRKGGLIVGLILNAILAGLAGLMMIGSLVGGAAGGLVNLLPLAGFVAAAVGCVQALRNPGPPAGFPAAYPAGYGPYAGYPAQPGYGYPPPPPQAGYPYGAYPPTPPAPPSGPNPPQPPTA
jgi:hypothetical protein